MESNLKKSKLENLHNVDSFKKEKKMICSKLCKKERKKLYSKININ